MAGNKRLHPLPMPWRQLPDGAMVQQAAESFLIVQGKALRVVAGRLSRSAGRDARPMLLTPPSTLRALSAGYRPVLHPSAISSKGGL